MQLIDELIQFLKANEDEINALHYASIKIVIQEGKIYTGEIAKQFKRGKDLVFSSLKPSTQDDQNRQRRT